MSRKLAHSLLLVVTVAAMMIGGDMVQEGRREMWQMDPSRVVASNEDGSTDAVEVGGKPIVDVASEEMIISKRSCPDAHLDW